MTEAPIQTADLIRANALMTEALSLLDHAGHDAAAYLDWAIVKLGVRPDGEGMPPEMGYHHLD